MQAPMYLACSPGCSWAAPLSDHLFTTAVHAPCYDAAASVASKRRRQRL